MAEHEREMGLTASASRYIDLGEHGGASDSIVVSKAKFRAVMPLDFNGRNLSFPVYK